MSAFYTHTPCRFSQRLISHLARLMGVSILILASLNSKAQDPIFSQFYLTPLQLNPGLAGLNEGPRFSINYRNQYPGFNNAYRTYALSYDQFFPGINSGAGFWLLSDDAGDGILKTIKAAGIFSYQLELNRNLFLKSGLEVGVVQTTLNWNKLLFGDQIDDYLGPISPGGIPYPTEEDSPDKNNVVYPDLGMGMTLYGGTMYAGVSIRHLNRPKPEFLNINPSLSEGIPMRWTVHAGASYRILKEMFNSRHRMTLSPSVIFVQQGPFQQFNGGVTLDTGPFSVGGFFRMSSGHAESIIGTIGLRTNKLRLGYSYDYTISGFPLSGGTHELGLLLTLNNGERESRYNDCFQIFR